MKYTSHLLCGAAAVMLSLFSTQAMAGECEPAKAAEKYPDLAKRTVNIATSPTFPPFTYADPDNLEKMTGLEIEMIEAVMECAGLTYKYFPGEWAGLLATLSSGAADVMVGNVVYRKDRAANADFVVYYRAGQTAIVPAGNPKNIAGPDDLCGLSSIACSGCAAEVQTLKISEMCVANGKKPISFQPSPDQESAARQLVNGRSDFMLDGSGSAVQRVAAQSSKIQAAFVVDTGLVAGFAVKEGNEEMLNLVYDGLKALENSGRLKKLMTKYGFTSELQVPVEIMR